MTAADRRMEIVSILVVSGHITSKELMQEFGICVRTICNSIIVLSYDYPIYTKPGAGGGVFIMDSYSHTTIYSHHTSRKNSKKCMMQRREKIKKSWNVFSENMGLIS